MKKKGLEILCGALILVLAAGSAAVAQSKCTGLKYKFAGKAAFLYTKCLSKAARKGILAESVCYDKAAAFLTKTWAKAEGKGDCLTSGDQTQIQARIDKFLTELVADLGTPLAPVCGNNTQESGEDCDGTDDVTCPGQCQGDCTCAPAATCGNNLQESGEECDGSDDSACPGQCTGGCTCGPVCNGCDPCNEMCSDPSCASDPTCGWFDYDTWNTCTAGFGVPPDFDACGIRNACIDACTVDPSGQACFICGNCGSLLPLPLECSS